MATPRAGIDRRYLREDKLPGVGIAMAGYETAHIITCAGHELVGILHRPDVTATTGFIAVPAGSVQYRAGSGRQLVHLGRSLAEQGYPLLRFDYRGMGDSSGEYEGFRSIGKDLASAVSFFRSELPAINRIILYGACEAATGILIHGSAIPHVGGAVIANPWVGDEGIKAAATRTHYAKRMFQKEFWKKLFDGKYNLKQYLADFYKALSKQDNVPAPFQENSITATRPFQVDMLQGFKESNFPVLLLMSGGSLLKREFEELVTGSTAWQNAIGRANCTRIDLPEADQTFSTNKSKGVLSAAILEWSQNL